MQFIIEFIRENKPTFSKEVELDKLELLICEAKEAILDKDLVDSVLLYTYCENQLNYCRFQMLPNLDNRLKQYEDSLVWLTLYTERYFNETDKSVFDIMVNKGLDSYLWEHGDRLTKRLIKVYIEGLNNA